MTPARRSPSPAVAMATAAGPRAASGLRGAAPPKKLRPGAGPGPGPGVRVVTIAMGKAAGDVPVPRRHPCLDTVPPPVPRLPARAALSPGGAPGRATRTETEAAAFICGPTGK